MVAKKLKRRALAGQLTDEAGVLSPLVSRLYRGRGITELSQVNHSLANLLKPSGLKGIDSAASLLADTMCQQQRIVVVGDFDADGATSTALMVHALKAMGADYVDYLVPNRFEFGYGLTPEIVMVAAQSKPDLIVTVDNGISSIDGVQKAHDLGIKTLITDHHLPGLELPIADAIVNPNQVGCNFESKNLAGVGVAFYLLSVLRQNLRQRRWFEQRPEVNLAEYLDLVALGTIADVVPMDKNNRILVQEGLRRIRTSHAKTNKIRPGIAALLFIAGKNTRNLTSTDLAFSIGPRLNAAGRLDDMSTGIECLLTDDSDMAQSLAEQLDQLNVERREIEATMRDQAMALMKDIEIKNDMVKEANAPVGLCLFEPDWHQGVVGIVASRVKEKYHRPVIAFAKVSDSELKGSARSIPGFHIRDALDRIAVKQPHLINKFGGHAMAAGLSLVPKHYKAFCAAFDAEARSCLTEDDLDQVVVSDGNLGEVFSIDLARQLMDICPWGQGFIAPLFDDDFEILEQRLLGGKHLKMKLQPMGDQYQYQSIDAIAFGVNRTVDGRYQKMTYRLDVNEYRGQETVQLIVDCLDLI